MITEWIKIALLALILLVNVAMWSRKSPAFSSFLFWLKKVVK